MRSEKVMIDLILSTARNDERIRAVLMTGSRTNPNVKKDIFQDYDITYIVDNINSFTSDHSWVDRFGSRIMMQMPEDMGTPANRSGHFIYLMQFTDGNRIDLTLIPAEKKKDWIKPESLRLVLLDKDKIIGALPSPSDQDFHIKKPTEKEFHDACNEFWWICMNIGKGLWREQLSYVMYMYEQINRNVLIQVLKWSIGTETQFSKSIGAFGKYLEDFLEDEDWRKFVSTYTDAHYPNIWEGLFTMCELFREAAIKVANRLNFEYTYEDDDNVMAYLGRIKILPKDAKKI